MAELGQAFDPNSVPDDDRNFDLMPAGWQNMHVIEHDVQATKDGKGQMIVLTWEILDGPYAKRRIWHRINYINQSAQAQEIGQRELGYITKALGTGPITSTEVLAFKPIQGRVGVDPAKDGFEAKNKVTAFKPYGAAGVAPPAQQQRAASPAASSPAPAASGGQAAAGGARPWAR